MAALYAIELLFDDLQQLHGTSLDADAAGDTLGNGIAFLMNHNLHGAYLNTLAATNALLLVDHVHAGLGILGDGTVGASLGAQTALGADHGLGSALALHDLDAGLGDIILLVESLGASLDALQAGHALGALLDGKLLHRYRSPFQSYFRRYHYTPSFDISLSINSKIFHASKKFLVYRRTPAEY